MEVTRKIIENHVGGVNKHLQLSVKEMSLRELLANSHPEDRVEYLKEKSIQKQLS